MFTGIVEELGKVEELTELSIRIACGDIAPAAGDSIAVNGVCLTATRPGKGRFEADLSEQTLRRCNLGKLKPGDPVNLERPMAAGGRFGGHIVQGHVDAVSELIERNQMAGSTLMRFSLVPEALGRYIAPQGSVALDGVSLTVAAVAPGSFDVSLIPHTLVATTLGTRQPGDGVNLEVDIIAKYVEQLVKYK